MEEGPKFNRRRPIAHSGKRDKQLVKYDSKNKMCECTLCGETWYEPANGNGNKRHCPRGCTGEDLHTKVWTRENSSQEKLEALVQKVPRLRPICRGGLNLGMEDLLWGREIKRV